jgi:integrase
MRRIISKSAVDRLRPGKSIADTALVGFVVRRWPSGVVTYGFRYRDKRDGGRQRWISIGEHGPITADQARAKALQIAKDVREHREPLTARAEAAQRRAIAGGTVNAALDSFLSRYVRPNLRSAAEVERCFNVYVRPAIGTMPLYSVRRRDVVGLLDRIEDSGAPVMADRVLAHLRKAFNWVAARDDQFTPPIVKGMARTKPKERARKRVLDDQEIRDLWEALEGLNGRAPACFPAFVRTLFLTGTRLRMVSDMTWQEVEGRDWIVPGNRNKGGLEHLVPLTDTVPLIGSKRTGFVFSSDGGKTAFKGFSKAKAALDAKLTEIRKRDRRPPMKHWTFHDLRRTARSLLSRVGITNDIAERVLGHVIPGVRGVYDRHEYRDEKKDALERLGALVERILRPSETIVSFPKSRKRQR